MVRPVLIAAVLAIALSGLVSPVLADVPSYSAYERDVVTREVIDKGGVVDPEPEGKRISRVDIVRLEVFDETDPVPDFLNIFHATTREHVVRRELLFREGELFSARRVAETARNLRLLTQLSLVLIVPVRDGDAVRVVVITKDVWSLRLNSDFEVGSSRFDPLLVDPGEKESLSTQAGNAGLFAAQAQGYALGLLASQAARTDLSYLLLNPSEENVLGTHASVGGLFVLLPYTYSTGVVLRHGRIFGSRHSGLASYNIVFNRRTGESEGSYGRFIYALPQYSADQKWMFKTGILWSDLLARVSVSTGQGSLLRGFWVPETRPFERPVNPGTMQRIFTYGAERYVGGTEVTRSFGYVHKVDLTLGVEADRRVYTPHVPAGTDARDERAFLAEVPMSDTRISPFIQLESYENEFLTTVELETLGLQEDFRLGHETLLRFYPASTRVGSTRDLIGVIAGLSYTFALGDGLVRAVATSNFEYAAEGKHQSLLDFSLRIATPRLGFGRLVFDSIVADRGYNYLNRRYALGGDDRLRGYPSGDVDLAGGESQRGADAFVINTEFRTTAVDILSAQCGLAAFYDVGDAADNLSELDTKQSAGLGLRVVLPQANRIVFRADWAVPLSPGYQSLPGTFFVTFEQAFPMRGLVAPDIESLYLQ